MGRTERVEQEAIEAALWLDRVVSTYEERKKGDARLSGWWASRQSQAAIHEG